MVIVVCGLKGGVGKSLVAALLSFEYEKSGKKTLLIDTDIQGSLLNLADIARERAKEKQGKLFDFIPDIKYLAEITDLYKKLSEIKNKYKIVIIDTPPSNNVVLKSSIVSADLIIIPCLQGFSDVWALSNIVNLIKKAKEVSQFKAYFLLNKLDLRNTLSRDFRETLNLTSIPIFQSSLGNRVAFVEAFGSARPITSYAGKTKASQEMRALLEEIQAIMKI